MDWFMFWSIMAQAFIASLVLAVCALIVMINQGKKLK